MSSDNSRRLLSSRSRGLLSRLFSPLEADVATANKRGHIFRLIPRANRNAVPGKKHGARASRKAAINLGSRLRLFEPPISRDDGAQSQSVAAESTWNPGNTFDRWNNSFRRKSTLFPVYSRPCPSWARFALKSKRSRILRSTLYVFSRRRIVPLSDAIYLSISSIPGDDLRHNCPGGGGGISELRVCGFIRPTIRNQSCAESSLPTNKFFVYLRLILPLYGFFTIESTCKILYRVLITSFEEVDSSFFLNLAHDDIFFLGRRWNGLLKKISLEAERIAVPLKSSSLNRNDTPIYIYIYT